MVGSKAKDDFKKHIMTWNAPSPRYAEVDVSGILVEPLLEESMGPLE